MKIGSQWSSGPHVPKGIDMVACRVAGFRRVGVVGVWPLRARTAAMSAVVASTCANVGFTLAEGRYRTLIPADVGCRFQASVRCLVQVVASVRVSTKSSFGEMTSLLQHKSAWVCPADADMQSSSIAVGLDMVFSTPTMACTSLSALLSQPSRASV